MTGLFLRQDWIVFSVLTLALIFMANFLLIRFRRSKGLSWFIWPVILALAVVAVFFAEWMGQIEMKSIKNTLDGFAPTYAYEVQELGHSKIGLDTPADDPVYLKLIQSEKDWLRINLIVNDIYTFRKRADGKIILLVDSETDYDHNGRYEGDREQRTAIGEVYDQATDGLKRAFDKEEIVFDGTPYTDRWGTWVSAYAPLKDAEGRLEGVLGVDYSAGKMTLSIQRARTSVFLYFFALILVILVSAFSIAWIKETVFQKRNLQEQLMQSQKMSAIGRLAAGMAHEVKNPLAVIMLGAQVLKNRPECNDPLVKDLLKDMEDAVVRADKVIKGVLDFSIPKKLALKNQRMDQVIRQSVEFVRHEFHKKQIIYSEEFSKDVLWAKLDLEKSQQVFINLFTNSTQAVPVGGRLTVKAYEKNLNSLGGRVGNRTTDLFKLGEKVMVVEILDNGSGIAAEQLPHIFDPFFTTKPAGQGTGLGLSVVQTIMGEHQGTVEISNRVEGGIRVVLMFHCNEGGLGGK